MAAITSWRMSIKERREFLATLQSEGWIGAGLDDTPRYAAKSDGMIGWGYDRESAKRDLRAAMKETG